MSDSKVTETRELIIVIDDGYQRRDFDCPICQWAIRGLEDVESINSYGCCYDCQDFFYWPNLERWKNGWRPKKEEVRKQLNNYYRH